MTALFVEVALAFTPGRGWHYVPAPPEWWWDLQADLLEQDERVLRRRPVLRLVASSSSLPTWARTMPPKA